MTQRRVENTSVHFWTFSPVSVKMSILITCIKRLKNSSEQIWLYRCERVNKICNRLEILKNKIPSKTDLILVPLK